MGFRVDEVFRSSFDHGSGLLLDFGCNIGKWVPIVESMGYKYIGFDQSLKALKIANDLHYQRSFIRGMGQFLPFRSSVFDVVIEVTVFQHNSNRTKSVMLREIRRVLKNLGVFFLFDGIFNDKPEDYTDDRCFTKQGWVRFTEGHGFKLKRFKFPIFQFVKVDL